MPQGCGVANTTDSGTSYVRTFISTNGVAYITGQPAPPQLTAQFKGLPEWMRVNWSMTLVSERPERGNLDNRTIQPVELRGSVAYHITMELFNEIVGGRCNLNIQVANGPTVLYPFFIRGKNPLDATARAYITAHVDPEFQSYAWMIAKHESLAPGGRVYNQFNPSNPLIERPNKTAGQGRWGWGIAQIDKDEYGDSTAEVYDWHENVASMNVKLRDALATHNRFVGYFRDLYINDPTTQWIEPNNILTNVNGYVVSAEMWSVLTFYNGAGGCPELTLAGKLRSVPIEFVPTTTNWIFHVNSENYVYKTIFDRNLQETE